MDYHFVMLCVYVLYFSVAGHLTGRWVVCACGQDADPEDPDFTFWLGDWVNLLFFWSFCLLFMLKMAVIARLPLLPDK